MPRKIKELTIPDGVKSLQPVGQRLGRDVYDDNPFINASQGFCIHVRQDMAVVARGLTIHDTEDETISAGVIGQIKYVDSEEFVKLYTKNVATIFNVGLTAQKVLIAAIVIVQKEAIDKAEIYMTHQKACKIYESLNFTKIPSRASFSQGVSQLIKAGFLAVSSQGDGWYWFNPNLIFNGDRVRFVQEYKIKRKAENENALGSNT